MITCHDSESHDKTVVCFKKNFKRLELNVATAGRI